MLMMKPIYLVILSNVLIASILLGAYYVLEVQQEGQVLAQEQIQQRITELSDPNLLKNKISSVPCTAVPSIPVPCTIPDSLLALSGKLDLGLDVCKWQFQGYQSSKWEQLWVNNISQWQAAPCERFNLDGNSENAQKTVAYSYETQVVNINTPPNYDLFSKLTFRKCDGETVDVPIEPLVLLTRSPLACTNVGDLGVFTNKSYMVVDWAMATQMKDAKAKAYYFDAGASTYTAGAGGASQNWMIDWIEKKGITLSGIFAWELSAIAPTDVWNQIPGRLWPIYHWYNIPVATKEDHTNPLTILKQVAKPEDLVIFKLDIDHVPTETALIDQILRDKEASNLIDVLFWEYHVTSKENSNYWGDAGHKYTQLYDIFVKLRQLGIRAHSWV